MAKQYETMTPGEIVFGKVDHVRYARDAAEGQAKAARHAYNNVVFAIDLGWGGQIEQQAAAAQRAAKSARRWEKEAAIQCAVIEAWAEKRPDMPVTAYDIEDAKDYAARAAQYAQNATVAAADAQKLADEAMKRNRTR